MKQFRGLWFPDGETHLIETIRHEGPMLFAGAGVYQFKKLAKGIPLIWDFGHAVDIGAHIGTWSRVLARMFSWVTAFEPVPAHRECFDANIPIDDRPHVRLLPYALGETSTIVHIRENEASSGSAHVAENGAIIAEMRTLDSFNLQGVDFIKIDCEGFEHAIVKGGAETIKRCHPTMIVEQKPHGIAMYGQNGEPMAVKLLESWGAKVAWEYSGDYCLYWKK